MYFATLVALAALSSNGVTSEDLVAYPDTVCPSRNVPLEGRKSPLDSITFTVASKPVKVCYGRPSARGRTMLGGGSIPYGKLWRTGANEPTIFYAPVPLRVAGLSVPPGVYSLYTVPGPKDWEVIVNRSTEQWGQEGHYTDEVKAQELGRGKVKSEVLKTPVETFTIKAEPAGDKAVLLLDWEKTRVRIPVQAAQ
ncbi:MAG: hypothetical protein QOH59_705 [Gemmatimonadales bacterium]|jgi:hypothetical protein|nr:hypothetical protein [Gemmatimonadales bacterium]